MKPGSLIQMDWHSTQEGTQMVKLLLQPNNYKRRQYGFLEKPNFPAHVEEVNYKIYVSGSKAGLGKTSTINRLAGNEASSSHHETTGINVTAVYWPVMLIQGSKVIVFRLEFWEAGETTEKKFGHVLPSCKEEMAAVMLLFSFTDKGSFDSIPDQILSNAFAANEDIGIIVVGTRYDLHTMVDVTAREVRDFEQKWKVPVIRMKNVQHKQPIESQSKTLQKAEFNDVAVALNIICEQLWGRHQQTT